MSRRAVFTDTATLKVACPTCGARSGRRCFNKSGRQLGPGELHAARERALREERRRLLQLQAADQGSLFEQGGA